jgi:hypothetical protein
MIILITIKFSLNIHFKILTSHIKYKLNLQNISYAPISLKHQSLEQGKKIFWYIIEA